MNEENLGYINKETLVEIADAIRNKTGKTEEIQVENLASEIDDISISNLTIKKINNFKGCNFNSNCAINEFSQAVNLSSRRYPALSPRQIKYTLNRTCSDFYIYNDAIYYVSSGSLYKDNKAILTLASITANKRYFSVVGNLLIIMPDKQYYDTKKRTCGSLEASVTCQVDFKDGTRNGVAAKSNCIYSSEMNFGDYFRVGDAIDISGSTSNDGRYIVREIDGASMMFDEGIFNNESEVSVTLSRTVPSIKFTFECNNRLWGIYNNAIYASALGDPFNFNKFEGLPTDSYYKKVFSSGEFTGASSYGNTPVFFKETMIYRMFGDTPDEFSLEIKEAPGVSYSCDMTIAKVNGALMYASFDGIYSYNGSYPVKVSQALGNFRTGRGCAGSDGCSKYYISISDFKGIYSSITDLLKALDARRTYVYNTETKTWHRFDDTTVINRIECGNYGSSQDKPNVFALDDNGKIFTISDEIAGSSNVSYYTDEREIVVSEGITGIFRPDEKSILQNASFFATLASNAKLTVSVSYDNSEFVNAYEIVADENGISENLFEFDFSENVFNFLRFKFAGEGDFTLHDFWFEYESETLNEIPSSITEERVNELIADALANIPTAEAMTFELEG